MHANHRFRELFVSSHDVVVKDIGELTLIYSEGLCDTNQIHLALLPAIAELGLDAFKQNSVGGFILDLLPKDSSEQAIISAVFAGILVIHNRSDDALYTADFANQPQRSPEDSNSETGNLGPRDSFTESIVTNVALIRKRLRTNSLHNEQFIVGRRTQTRVSLLYMDDIISKEYVHEVRERLKSIDIDALYSAEQLKRLISQSTFALVPTYGVTTRPDMILESLLAGRFALFIDGVPVAIVAPVNLSYLLMAAEDVHTPQHHVAFISLIRLAALFITYFLPGFWISLVTYHQDQIPFGLLATISVASDGTPFNEAFELFIVLLMFQLFMEAGNRLPSSVGSMLSVVGGLIIGDAAIRSGISSPATLLIAGISSTSAFVLMPNTLGLGSVIVRLYVLIVASFLGLFGFFLSFFSVILYAASIRSYGVPFLVPFSPLRFPDILYTIFYLPWKKRTQRPKFLNVQDKGKQPQGDDAK
jgi:hypothetical protein